MATLFQQQPVGSQQFDSGARGSALEEPALVEVSQHEAVSLTKSIWLVYGGWRSMSVVGWQTATRWPRAKVTPLSSCTDFQGPR